MGDNMFLGILPMPFGLVLAVILLFLVGALLFLFAYEKWLCHQPPTAAALRDAEQMVLYGPVILRVQRLNWHVVSLVLQDFDREITCRAEVKDVQQFTADQMLRQVVLARPQISVEGNHPLDWWLLEAA